MVKVLETLSPDTATLVHSTDSEETTLKGKKFSKYSMYVCMYVYVCTIKHTCIYHIHSAKPYICTMMML